MKRVFAVFLVLLLCGCSTASSSKTFSEIVADEWGEFGAAEFYDAVNNVWDDDFGSFLQAADIPNSRILIEELISAGEYDDIKLLQKMCDDAGYYPSVLFGQYVADRSTKCIHSTDGKHFTGIAPKNLMVLSPMPSIDDVIAEIHDSDNYLDGYSICSCC